MSHRHRRTAASIAWSLVLLSTLLALSALVLKIINGASLQQIILESPPIGVELALTFPIVGAVIAARHPYNPLGWIFCAIGLSQGVVELSYDYARRTLVLEPGSLPGGDLMAWLSSWTWIPGFGLLITFSLLLFPTGHLVSRRWRYVAWIAAGVMTMMVLLISVALWPYRGSALLANNERLSAGADAALSLFEIGLVILLASAALSLISLIVRYRRARGEERLQLRWFTFTAVLMIFPVLVSTYEGLPLAVNRVGSLFALLVAPCLPTAIGVAILQHRLYDIDVVINRTLVYGSLAAFITGVYVWGSPDSADTVDYAASSVVTSSRAHLLSY